MSAGATLLGGQRLDVEVLEIWAAPQEEHHLIGLDIFKACGGHVPVCGRVGTGSISTSEQMAGCRERMVYGTTCHVKAQKIGPKMACNHKQQGLPDTDDPATHSSQNAVQGSRWQDAHYAACNHFHLMSVNNMQRLAVHHLNT